MIIILLENSCFLHYVIMKINFILLCQGIMHIIVNTAQGARPNSVSDLIRALAQPSALLLSWFVIVFIFTLSICESGIASEITPIEIKQINGELFVTVALQADQKLIDDLGNGLSKELVFYIDLFRHWKVWPDEFVLGKKIVRSLHSDPIKREYIGSSTEGNIRTIRRFKDVDSMIAWGVSIRDLKLTNVKALEPDEYYIKVTSESNLKKLPPVIGYLLFFTPSKEFSVSKESPLFRIPNIQEAR